MLKRLWERLVFRMVFGVLAAILPLNLIAVLAMIRMNDQILSQTRSTVKSMTDMYADALTETMEKADRFMYQLLSSDPDGITLSRQEDSLGYENARIWSVQKMQENLPASNGFSGYFVYPPKKEDIAFAYRSGYIQKSRQMQEYVHGQVEAMESVYRWRYIVNEGCPYAFRMSKLGGVYYGSYLDLSNTLEQLDKNMNYDNYRVVIDVQEQSTAARTQVAVNSACERADFYVSAVVDNVSVFYSAELWERVMVILILLCVACAPLLFLYLRRTVLVPLMELNHAHSELEHGNRDYRIRSTAGAQEIQNVFSSFNQMADNIHDLRLANMQKELEKSELERNNLQLQIRPHFLMNTFNLMYNLASRRETQSLQELILYLSDYFRYIFKSENKMELFDKELRLIEGYMKSIQIRYPDRVEIVYQIDPEISLVRVPPLFIHNFIENAIKHAMKDEEVLFIMLCASYEAGEVTFQISDNGKGMAPEQVNAINEHTWNGENGGHVGLCNSIRRLRHAYGEDASLTVDSELGAGTVFTITFPYDLEEK